MTGCESDEMHAKDLFMKKAAKKKIGVVVGGGTGSELADHFEYSIRALSEVHGCPVEIVRCPRVFASYHDVRMQSLKSIEDRVREDETQFLSFLRSFRLSGGRSFFRTAFNADVLYRCRRIAAAVKPVIFPRGKQRILFVRDMAQGYYANDTLEISHDIARFSGSISNATLESVMAYAFEEADKVLSTGYSAWAVYKFHLFANVFEAWTKKRWPSLVWMQPNHATEVFVDPGHENQERDLLIVVGNEIGDILHEVLVFVLNLGRRSTVASRCVYLSSEYRGLEEYQTVHGSVDDLAGKDCVNPGAMLNAVGMVAERELGIDDAERRVCKAMDKARSLGYATPDEGGSMGTRDVVRRVVDLVVATLGR